MSSSRTALVSGGSGAIGSAICRQLHEGGFTVVIGYNSKDRGEELARELDPKGKTSWAIPLDMSDRAQIRSSLTGLLGQLRTVDVVVFNAGKSKTARFVDTDEDQWAAEIQINYLGPVLATWLCLPAMLAAGGGRLIAITSEAAKVGDGSRATYSASKAALHSFFRTIVREYGARGILANSVAPGPIDTPMLRSAFGSPEKTEKALGKLRRLVPLDRLGEPEEVASVVRALAEDFSYIAGQQISVGGGVSMC
jgi:NAD(P)-dependent dehydrogenase (short-subunit alcohol dehydrogenase family)